MYTEGDFKQVEGGFLCIPKIADQDDSKIYLISIIPYGGGEHFSIVSAAMLEPLRRRGECCFDILQTLSKAHSEELQECLIESVHEDGLYPANILNFQAIIRIKEYYAEQELKALRKRKKLNKADEKAIVSVKKRPPLAVIPLIPPSTKKGGFVYLLKTGSDVYKIGRAKDPNNRLRVFNVKLPFEVEFEHLIATENMYLLERELHQRFASKRVNGEWFRLDMQDIDYIKSL